MICGPWFWMKQKGGENIGPANPIGIKFYQERCCERREKACANVPFRSFSGLSRCSKPVVYSFCSNLYQ